MYRITREVLEAENKKFLEQSEKLSGKFKEGYGFEFKDGRIVELYEFVNAYLMRFLNPEDKVLSIPQKDPQNPAVYYQKVYDFRQRNIVLSREAMYALGTLYLCFEGCTELPGDEDLFIENLNHQSAEGFLKLMELFEYEK
jgi:hypothetical protein